MVVDDKGKVFGKISILDIALVLIIIGLIGGVFYTKLSNQTAQIVNNDQEFYTTFAVKGVRNFSVDGVKEGDMFYEQHGAVLGECAEIYTKPATEILHRDDGTADLVPLEGKHDLYIKLKCKGNISEKGFFVNGNRQVSPGNEIEIQSNSILTDSLVYGVSESK